MRKVTGLPAEQPDTGAPCAPIRSKIRQIFDAARALFLCERYDSVTTDRIARAANVSKATVYAHFSGKEALFSALVADACRRMGDDIWPPPDAAADVEAVLTGVAQNFVTMFSTGDHLALYRIAIAETPRFPDIGHAFFAQGPETLQGRIAAFLAEATERGLLHVPDPALAALQFIGLVSGDIPLRALLALPPRPADEVRRLVASSVGCFAARWMRPGR